MATELATHLKLDLLSTFQRRVVARAVAGESRGDSVLSVIDQMSRWATRLYEGAPISSAVGLSDDEGGEYRVSFNDISANDFGAVLSNGYDTLMEFDRALGFVAHHVLAPPQNPPPYCPSRQEAIARWTSHDDGRIAIVLNRVGEILIFRHEQLLFARRSGVWHFLTHEPIIRQMGVPKDPEIRKAVYETALDASFARTGACLGIVSSTYGRKWEKIVVEDDRLLLRRTSKSRAIAKAVESRKFHKLDRKLRQELVAIDGATVLDYEGRVLAVGAILKIEGGSTGGGRTAAATRLGKLGLGIKVSQDSGITGYRSTRSGIAFRVM